jgi:hypothetical protein
VRGLGYSLAPLILNILGTCVTRTVWVYLIFPLEQFHTFSGLALLYPVSWSASAVLLAGIAVVAFRKIGRIKRQMDANEKSEKQVA